MGQKLAFLHAITPLHSGTGQGVGSIDLPIARERATKLPIVPGSSLKGCLRDALSGKLKPAKIKAIFGPERGQNAADHAGALRLSDARLLLLPVRSLGATFVWATCPFVLKRLNRDATAAGFKNLPAVPVVAEGEAYISAADPLVTIGKEKRLVLEELDFSPKEGQHASAWQQWISARLFREAEKTWRDEMKNRFAIIDDNNFTFLAEFATEVTARIAINDATGTVDPGALWYEEALPAESVLVLILQATASMSKTEPMTADEVLKAIPETSDVQFGGKATTGSGVARFVPIGVPQ